MTPSVAQPPALPTALDPLLHVVLVEPQIPANTGNAARTCAALGCTLHLVGNVGFTLDDAALRRAGLDYWPSVDLHWHPSLDDVEALVPGRRWRYFTAQTNRLLHDVGFQRGDVLVFGREDTGLPQALLDAHRDELVRIPQRSAVRSINLSTCVGIATYEAFRQIALS
ncbi:MAG: tRNA (cytidine(34)-2'-O)-methyltransferase [Myxococcota bacterium]